MEYRAGKCSACGAEYKIPASFAHDVARCKECGGVVKIGKVGEPAPTGPAPTAKPVPARKVAPSGESKPPLKEYKPSGKKGAGPSMLDKLKAQRQGDGAPAERAPRPAAAKKPAPAAAASKRAPVQAGARRGAPAADKARPGRGSRSDRGSSSRRGRGDDGEKGSARRGRRRPEKPEKKLPVAGLIGLGVLILVVVVFWIFKDDIMGTGETDGGPRATAANAAEQTPDTAAAEETPAEDLQEDAEAAAPEPTPEEEPAADAPADEPKPKKRKGDPDSIDLAAIPDYGPVFDTTTEEWTMMNESMKEWMDPWAGAAGTRAGKRILELKVKAMPVILNHFKTLDLSTDEGNQNGKTLNRAIQDLCNGTNFGWKHPDQEPDDYLYFNKKVVQSWCRQWDRVLEQGIEYWIKMGKMDERDPKEAKRLRKLYGDASATPDAPPPAAGMEDDLDVD